MITEITALPTATRTRTRTPTTTASATAVGRATPTQTKTPAGQPTVTLTPTSSGPTPTQAISTYQTRTPYRLGGFKFLDLDYDGVRDPGEPGLGKMIIVVRNEAGEEVASGESMDAPGKSNHGFWQIYVPAPGIYTVEEEQAEGFEQTYPDTNDGVYRVRVSASGYRLLSPKPKRYRGLYFGSVGGECQRCLKHLAVVGRRPSGAQEIYRANLDGTGAKALTYKQGKNADPSPNFSGTKIAFASDRDGDWEIYTMNPSGAQQNRITKNDKASDLAPSWACYWIAFQTDRDGNWEIYKTDPWGKEQIRLTNNPASDVAPAWSRDGQQIAFASNRDGNWEIYVMDAEGQNVKRLTNDKGQDRNPSWSLDGAWVVFESDRGGQADLYKLELASGKIVRLTNDPAIERRATWTSYCEGIYYDRESEGVTRVYRMLPDGSNPRPIGPDPKAKNALQLWLATQLPSVQTK